MIGQILSLGAFILVMSFFATVIALSIAYIYIARQLPPPEELQARADAQFVSSQIYARDGSLLYELMDPSGGKRQKISEIPELLRLATIDTEDPNFYRHPGFDPVGIVRVLWYAANEREFVAGGSTITQQLVRSLLLTNERTDRTFKRKVKEIILAYEITRRYDRSTILEMYLNEAYFGNLAYGVEAASQTYFGKSAKDLTLAEASFIAGLPQSPAVYDPFTTDGRIEALRRQKDVLRLMVKQGDITQQEADAAAEWTAAYKFVPPRSDALKVAPHFVVYVRQLLEQQYGPEALYREGLKVYTTLDPKLQATAEEVAREQIAKLQDKHVTNAALVALDAHTGEILAMLGSVDFNNKDIDGQVNVALRPRQPGSSIKPLAYVTAFQKGWTPATLIWDVPTVFTNTFGQTYSPKNYDSRFHGPVTVRSALANSYNIPAVKTLDFVGLPAFLDTARAFGITTLTRDDYWLALTLGGGEVPLIEMAGAYQVFANAGTRMPPVAIRYVTNVQGKVICQFTPPGQDSKGIQPCQPSPDTGKQIITPQHAYLITSILSDKRARCPAFGCPNSLELSVQPVAAKTGTTNDYKDNWTMGYTPDLVVGVWVGNSDNTAMKGTTGVTGAAPIWHDFLEKATKTMPVKDFSRPPGIVEQEICADTGTLPSEFCSQKTTEVFAKDQPPLGPEQDPHRPTCPDVPAGVALFGYPGADTFVRAWAASPEGQKWAQARGVTLAPMDCSSAPGIAVGPVVISIASPAEGATIAGNVPIVGTVSGELDRYEVTWARGQGSGAWEWISGPHLSIVDNGPLTEWNVSGLDTGEYTLRIVAYARQGGGTTEARVHVRVDNANAPAPQVNP
jgi:1A family penicillin-binding protein